MRLRLVYTVLSIWMITVGHTVKAQLYIDEIPLGRENINQSDAIGKQGVWYLFDTQTGLVLSKETYVDNILNGEMERYWNNGTTSERGTYVNGKLNGKFLAYWENSVLRGEVSYENGQLSGIATSYDRNGEITSRFRYVGGELDSSYSESFHDTSRHWDGIHPMSDTLKAK